MKDNKIAIVGNVGSGLNSISLASRLQELGHANAVVISPEEAKELSTPFKYQKEVVYEYKAAPMLKSPFEGKEFICKGKHQYREVKTREELNEGVFIKVEWVCQCGRIL